MDLFKNIVKEKFCFSGEQIEEQQAMHIVFGTDKNFVRPMGISLTSVLLHNLEEKLVFHIFTDEMYDEDIEKLKMLAEEYKQIVYLYIIDPTSLDQLPTNRYVSHAVYYKLIMARFLWGKVGKILYLDSDTLCVGKIREFYNIDIEQYAIAAAGDSEKTRKKQVKEFMLKQGTYFNAGVMLVNTEKWNEYDISNHAVELRLSEQMKQAFFLDQDVLNILLDEKVKYVDKRFNRLYGFKSENDAVPDDTVIIHYAGRQKPWSDWVSYRPMAKLYLQYAEKSLWRDVPLSSPRNYQDMKWAAQAYGRRKEYGTAALWYAKYAMYKIKERYM